MKKMSPTFLLCVPQVSVKFDLGEGFSGVSLARLVEIRN